MAFDAAGYTVNSVWLRRFRGWLRYVFPSPPSNDVGNPILANVKQFAELSFLKPACLEHRPYCNHIGFGQFVLGCIGSHRPTLAAECVVLIILVSSEIKVLRVHTIRRIAVV